MNIKECVVFDAWFVPPEEFREFFEQRGYQPCDMLQLNIITQMWRVLGSKIFYSLFSLLFLKFLV